MWGYEMVIDCKDCDEVAIKSADKIKKFVDELIKKIDMQKLGDFHYVDLEETPETLANDTAGISCCQFISTSSITGHFANKSKSVYLNIFSCKPFKAQDVKKMIEKHFKPSAMREYYITRDA